MKSQMDQAYKGNRPLSLERIWNRTRRVITNPTMLLSILLQNILVFGCRALISRSFYCYFTQ